MLDLIFNSLWGWLGLGGAIAVGLAVAGYFFPPFRNILWTAAAAVGAAAAIYAKGSADAARRKQQEWDAAELRMVERGHKARADAERSVDDGGVSDDEFNRDRRKVRRP